MAQAPSLPLVLDARDAAAQFANLVDDAVERAAVLYLDPDRRLLGRSDFAGSADRVAPSLRTIVGAALRLDAAALVLGHGHPAGTADPSAADIAYTRELGRVADAVGLVLLDHLILAGREVASLREAGWM